MTAKEALGDELFDFEARHHYAEILLHSSIAVQIKTLRLQRGWSQEKLAELSGMKQSRISAMEQADYSGWSISTLQRLAKAFDLVLLVRIESFGAFLGEVPSDDLQRPSFADDPAFAEQDSTVPSASSVAEVVRMNDHRIAQLVSEPTPAGAEESSARPAPSRPSRRRVSPEPRQRGSS